VRFSPALDLSFPAANPELVDLVTATLDDYGPAAIHETGPDEEPRWLVYFADAPGRDRAGDALRCAFDARGLRVARTDVPDEDWAARSQAALRAVRVGRVVVAPPWDVPTRPERGDVLVVVRPSMGFGTGHHETTRLCLGLLQEVGCDGRRVLDVGTGSGVLALAAAALGAREVVGLDVDPDAVENARENLALNRALADAATVAFETVDLRAAAPAPADVVLANLTGALLAASAGALLACTRPGGRLLVSGLLAHEADAVLRAFAGEATLIAERAEGDWRAAVLERRTPAV
jgi:ribosomal protein L11 methyltransferase